MLFAGDGSKPIPVIVTFVPIGPDTGLNEVITGGTTAATVLRKTDTDPAALAIARSAAPSPSMSPMAKSFGVKTVLKDTGFANEAAESAPSTLVFRYTNA